jgi:hypothetical protein
VSKVIAMSRPPSRHRSLLALVLLVAAVALSACGSGTAPPVSGPPVTTASGTAGPTAPASSPGAVDVAAAERAALALYVASPNSSVDPTAGTVWSSAPAARSPLAPAVAERLAALTRAGWFAATRCGEDYVVGNQVGLDTAPVVVASRANADGTVTVVVRGSLNGTYRDLTVTVADVDGRWLVTDLARGTGANASIFSAEPAC